MTRIPALLLLLSAAAIAQAQATGEVRIYRCTDAAGKQTLRDTPCPKGQTQQTRDMLRPKDAPTSKRPAPPVPGAAPQVAPAPVLVGPGTHEQVDRLLVVEMRDRPPRRRTRLGADRR